MSTLKHLECSNCKLEHKCDSLQSLCISCGKPLIAIYDLKKAAETLTKESLKSRENTMWRYAEVLPVLDNKNRVSLVEGWTPLLTKESLGESLFGPSAASLKVYIKDESRNPTGSFKDRGLSCSVSKAKELGAKTLAIPSAGNAGGSFSAYTAVANIPAYVFLPKDVPEPFLAECKARGAKVELVDGLIDTCGLKVKEGSDKYGWFGLSTMKEPYRVEGKKTMGYEIVEQLDWKYPDVLIYPCGGGTGVVGIWKAFDEMEEMGLISGKRPRFVCVQSETCAPIATAFKNGEKFAKKWENAKTIADGLRVPQAIADFLILKVLRESNGTVVTVSDEDMVKGCNLLGRAIGLFSAPEGGACVIALNKLFSEGWIKENEKVVIFNTGTGLKYTKGYLKYTEN